MTNLPTLYLPLIIFFKNKSINNVAKNVWYQKWSQAKVVRHLSKNKNKKHSIQFASWLEHSISIFTHSSISRPLWVTWGNACISARKPWHDTEPPSGWKTTWCNYYPPLKAVNLFSGQNFFSSCSSERNWNLYCHTLSFGTLQHLIYTTAVKPRSDILFSH